MEKTNIIYIRGCIGAGKSTIIQCLSDKYKYDNIIYIQEPINYMSKKLEKNTDKSIRKLQNYMLQHHENIYKTAKKNMDSIYVVEGSYEDNYIFKVLNNHRFIRYLFFF